MQFTCDVVNVQEALLFVGISVSKFVVWFTGERGKQKYKFDIDILIQLCFAFAATYLINFVK